MTVECIKITGTLISILGSIILAYRVTGILKALALVAGAHEVNIQQLMPGQTGNIYNLQGSTQHVEKASKKGLLLFGFFCYIISGILQLTALFMQSA